MRTTFWQFVVVCSVITVIGFLGCNRSTAPSKTLTMATTTSTQDSGLLDVLLPMFRKQTGIEVKVIAAGSGQALELGRSGDVDVLLTHAPQAEEEFVRDGFGERRVRVFHNDFVLVGPDSGPLTSSLPASIDMAFHHIAEENLPFVSRGDDSGTHRKEIELWKAISIEPQFSNYLRAGTGMAQALRIADEKRAYTLADRATYLSHKLQSDLHILVAGGEKLINPYSVIVVNPNKHAHVHTEAARRFVEFLTGKEVQQVVAEFGKDKYGETLFFVDTPASEQR